MLDTTVRAIASAGLRQPPTASTGLLGKQTPAIR